MTKGAKRRNTVIEGYDAVAEVRNIRNQLAEEMQGMTADEKVAFIEAEAAEFRRSLTQPNEKRTR